MVGDVIRGEREKRGWSQRELARLSGVAQAYISMLEQGQRLSPSGDVLQKIATVFDMTVDDLLKDGIPPADDLAHAPIDLLRAVWPADEVASLEADWPALAADARAEYWADARRWYAKRREIAEARKLLDDVQRLHREQDVREAGRRVGRAPRPAGSG